MMYEIVRHGDPRALMQTAWLFISLYFGRRGRENEAAMKKSISRFVTTADWAEYFELKRAEMSLKLCLLRRTTRVESTLRTTTQTARYLQFPAPCVAQ